MAPSPMVVYADACTEYCDGDVKVRFVSNVTASSNVYKSIGHNILTEPSTEAVGAALASILVHSPLAGQDPVFNTVMEAVTDLYARTFWANYEALKTHLSLYSLARRGYNVDTLTFYKGPGGVGLSLLSAHLAAMEGDTNHKFIDPGVFIDEDKMYKNIELLASGYIFTCQESPEGAKPIREDLLKKVITAEGIAGRLPYSVITRMFKLLGWKRFETNKMPKFSGVTPGSLQSLLRRCCVFEVKSRFLDKDHHEMFPPSIENVGIFKRDPQAMELLVSSPGILAGLRMLSIHEMSHDKLACRKQVSSYIYGGGDGGATLRNLLEACPNVPRSAAGRRRGKIPPAQVRRRRTG